MGVLRSQPCRCLWRGFLQMIRTTPLRRTTLQCSQRALIDGLTFISALALLREPLARRAARLSLEPVRDAAASQIVRRQFHLDPVTGQDPDEVHPHLAAHVRQHAMAVLQLHAKHRVGERLHHRALDLDRIFFRHHAATRLVSTSGPLSVTAMVCSKCAARLPSLVTAVHPSSRMRTSYEPIVTIGSMATTMPFLSCGPWPGSPKFGICGSSCRFRPIPWPTNARTTPKPWASTRSEEHTSELQSQSNLVCRLLLEKKKKIKLRQTERCVY